MLVLMRHPEETIVIGDDIRITVLSVNGLATRIGVQASREIDVHRQEVYERIQREKEEVGERGIGKCV